MSAGSCFAANIIPFFESAGFPYVRTEFVDEADRYGYHLYSAAYGNIYTARQLRQLLERLAGSFRPIEDRWRIGEAVIDPFRPGLPDPAGSDEEFDLILDSHHARFREAIRRASLFIFTLGLTEAWVSKADGAVFPACPGTIAGAFDPERHAFVNFRSSDIRDDLLESMQLLKRFNPAIRMMATVSPVPLVATASGAHVQRATAYSKAALRVACEEAAQYWPDLVYFPAYEIVTGPHSAGFFEADLRQVSPAGVQAVMDVLFHHSETPASTADDRARREQMRRAGELSKALSERECEEMAADRAPEPPLEGEDRPAKPDGAG
nr:GSCFA domain-containing protein [Methylosinus sp. Sm6]